MSEPELTIFFVIAGIIMIACLVLIGFMVSRAIQNRKESETIGPEFDVLFSDDSHAASVFFEINEERIARGLCPLEFDDSLVVEAERDYLDGVHRITDPFFMCEADCVDDFVLDFWSSSFMYNDLWNEETSRIGIITKEQEIYNEEGKTVFRIYMAKISE